MLELALKPKTLFTTTDAPLSTTQKWCMGQVEHTGCKRAEKKLPEASRLAWSRGEDRD